MRKVISIFLLLCFKIATVYLLHFVSSTNPQRPGDLKESFDVGPVYDENFVSSSTILFTLAVYTCVYID